MGWGAMPDVKGIERVQRFRKARRERGDRDVGPGAQRRAASIAPNTVASRQA